MKNIEFIHSKITILLSLIFITVASCERPISEDVAFATHPATPGIFIDGFVGGLDYFPFGGSIADAFTVATNEAYLGTSSMRFDIPIFGMGYGGATFQSLASRNLTSYDALTFWAKASKGADINEIGFGIDGDTSDKYRVGLTNLPLTTKWTKYIIPIPDASKLFAEKGMFWYAEGAENATDEGGYTFWIDELKFEKLGTIGQSKPVILNGVTREEQSFVGSEIIITGLSQTLNVNGTNIKVDTAPAYFTFESSNTNVAIVNEKGIVTVVGQGTASITATLAGVKAAGALVITSTGSLELAPQPTRLQANVKSIFSDAYTTVTPSNLDPRFGGSTTQATVATTNGNSVILYTDNNYTGIIFENPVDASTLTHLHVDIYTQAANTSVFVEIRDIGANGVIDTDVNTGNAIVDDKRIVFNAASLTVGGWTSFDIPLNGDLATQKNNLGAVILVGGPNFIMDNIYFYR